MFKVEHQHINRTAIKHKFYAYLKQRNMLTLHKVAGTPVLTRSKRFDAVSSTRRKMCEGNIISKKYRVPNAFTHSISTPELEVTRMRSCLLTLYLNMQGRQSVSTVSLSPSACADRTLASGQAAGRYSVKPSTQGSHQVHSEVQVCSRDWFLC